MIAEIEVTVRLTFPGETYANSVLTFTDDENLKLSVEKLLDASLRFAEGYSLPVVVAAPVSADGMFLGIPIEHQAMDADLEPLERAKQRACNEISAKGVE